MRMNYLDKTIGIAAGLMLTSSVLHAAGSLQHQNAPERETIHGVSNAKYFKGRANGNFYIQAGTFKSEKNAVKYKHHLIKKYHYPVLIKKQGNYHITLIGPIHTADEVRAIHGSSSRLAPVPVTQEVAHSSVKPELHNKRFLIDKDGILPDPNHFEGIGAVGIANLRAADSNLGITSSETDRLVQTNRNDWDTFAGQLGIGYLYYLQGAQPYSENTQWFPLIEPEINGYYLSSTNLRGDVWRFGSSAFNDMTFKMPIESYRLMFDGALTVVSKRQYSLYAIGGIGNAWNRVGYSDADRNGFPCTDEFLNLRSTTRSSFAWEAGAGLAYAFNNRFALSLEYLYADLGKVKTPNTGFTGVITDPILVPANFSLTSQAVLLGLHVAI